jgi:hypothetical protein
MSDDKGDPGRPDRDRIDMNDPDEVRNWTQSLGVTKEELQRAVEAVGNTAGKVYDYLGRSRLG